MTEDPSNHSAPVPRWSATRTVVKYALSATIVALAVMMLMGLASMRESPDQQQSNLLIPSVRTFRVERYQGPLDLVVSGSVVPFREIAIAPQVAGVIVKKYPACVPGRFVRQGDKLFEIDRSDYELDLKTLDAEIVQADKMLEETRRELDGAVRNLELAQSEFMLQQQEYDRIARISGALSASELDQAKRALLAARQALTNRKNTLDTLHAREERLRAALDLAKARRAKAVLNLERTTIVATDDGVVVNDSVEPGNYAAAGTPMVTLEVTQNAEVRCNLTPSELNWLRVNTGTELKRGPKARQAVYELPRLDVEIYEKKAPRIRWRGVLDRVEGIGRDERTKTIPCAILVDEPLIERDDGYHVLVRGMYVKCRIEIPPDASRSVERVAFPEVGLRSTGYVWVVRQDKLVRLDVQIIDRTEVSIEGRTTPMIIVKQEPDGLQPGDEVVVTPIPQPTEGAPVIVQQTRTLPLAESPPSQTAKRANEDESINKTEVRWEGDSEDRS